MSDHYFRGTLERFGTDPKLHNFTALVFWAHANNEFIQFHAEGRGDNPAGQGGFVITFKLTSGNPPDRIYKIPSSDPIRVSPAFIFEQHREVEFHAIEGELELTTIIDAKTRYSGHLRFTTSRVLNTSYKLDINYSIPKTERLAL